MKTEAITVSCISVSTATNLWVYTFLAEDEPYIGFHVVNDVELPQYQLDGLYQMVLPYAVEHAS